MTNLMTRIRSSLLRATLSLVYCSFVLLAKSTQFRKQIRLRLMRMILVVLYYSTITPLAWLQRVGSRTIASAWTNNNVREGWCSANQSTDDPKLFTSFSSGRNELSSLERQQKKKYAGSLLVYDLLRPLKVLAEPPKEKELSTELYVMF